jgi:hypothetical protein
MFRRFVVVFGALALLAGACGGDEGNDVKTAAPKRTTTTEDATDTSLSTDVEAATGTTAKGGAVTTLKGATGTTAKAAAPPPTADPNAAPAPAVPGTYDYSQNGSTSQGAVPPRGTLVVSGSQVFTRNTGDGNSSDISMSFRSNGPFITKIVVRQQSAPPIACTFGSPVPAPPWPPTTGKSFSGHATCDNGFVADFSGSITGHGSDTVAGKAYETVIVGSTLHVTGNGIDVTVHDTQHWAPELRVPTYSHENIDGTGPFGVHISGDVTSSLLNSSPH